MPLLLAAALALAPAWSAPAALLEDAEAASVARAASSVLKGELRAERAGRDALSPARVFLLRAQDGRALAAAKLYDRDGDRRIASEQEARRRLQLLELKESGFARALGTAQLEDGRPLYVMEAAPGRSLRSWLGEPRKPGPEGLSALETRLARAGTALSELHRMTRGTVVPEARKKENLAFLRERLSALSKPAPERSWTLPDAERESMLARLAAAEPLYLAEASRLGWIHGDAHPGNVYVAADGKVTLIDLEKFGQGEAMDDVGRLLAALRLNNELEGYRLSAQDIARLESAFMRPYLRKLDPEKLKGTLAFHRLAMEARALWYARDETAFKSFVAAIRAVP